MDVLPAPARPYDPDSPLAYLMEIAAATVDEASEEEERDAAVTGAVHHLAHHFPYSLHAAIDADAWQGHPTVHEHGIVREHGVHRFEASAVAFLGGGLWLHHTLRTTEADGASDVLTLIVPCTCGRGYTDIGVDTEDDLIETLADLRPTYGRSLHDDSTPDCRSIQLAPPL
ncbi:hypothetical protein [Streptomyces sp. NPDC055210]